MKRIAAVVMAAALATPAAAADVTLLSGFVSWHSKSGYQERNNGLGVRIDSGEWAGWAAGVYRNSLDRTSVYVAREWLWPLAGPISVGAIAGAATGYRFALTPAVLPEAVVRIGRAELALVVQPLDLRDSPAFAAVQLRYSF